MKATVLAVLLAIPLCVRGQVSQRSIDVPYIDSLTPEIVINGLEFPTTKPELLRVFGRPTEITSRENIGPVDISDSIRTYYYPFGSFTVYDGDTTSEVDLDSVKIKGSPWTVSLLGERLTPNSKRSMLRKRFRRWVYRNDLPRELMLEVGDDMYYILDFRNGKLIDVWYNEVW